MISNYNFGKKTKKLKPNWVALQSLLLQLKAGRSLQLQSQSSCHSILLSLATNLNENKKINMIKNKMNSYIEERERERERERE